MVHAGWAWSTSWAGYCLGGFSGSAGRGWGYDSLSYVVSFSPGWFQWNLGLGRNWQTERE